MASISQLESEIANAEAEIERLNAQIAQTRADVVTQGKEALALASAQYAKLVKHMDSQLNTNSHEAKQLQAAYPPFFSPEWTEDQWRDYPHDTHAVVPFITIAGLEDSRGDRLEPFEASLLVPFIGTGQTLVVEEHEDGQSLALDVLQGLIERVAVMLPHACTFCLLDPEKLSASFPVQKNLPHLRKTDLEISRTLHDILADISRINQEYLTRQVDSFEKLPEQVRSSERFEFIIAANFPKDYDRRSVEYLQKISKTGPQAGKYVIVHYNKDCPLPPDFSMDGFGPLYPINLEHSVTSGPGQLKVKWSMPASSDVEKIMFDGLREAKPVEHNLSFSEITAGIQNAIWKGDSSEEIRVPVGSAGSRHLLELWFGTSPDKRQCSHGMLGAMTGSGKSNLYHVFICGLACRYSPEEVQLYLVDGKQGVEFQVYRDLPHAKVVSLETTPSLARSVLAELTEIMERRNALFQELELSDLQRYRLAGSPRGPMPRIVLIIDEYQTLFEDDPSGTASAMMLSLASQGRSAGLHMFVGSQHFGVPNMLHQSAIFGNMHLRVAMKMTDKDIDALTEFGKSGKNRIRACDLAGKVVINDSAGDDGANQSGKVAFLPDEERRELLKSINAKVAEQMPHLADESPILFNGKAQPRLSENPQIRKLFKTYSRRPSRQEWQEYAQMPQYKSGLGESEWFSGECPSAFWLGQEFNMHGQAKAILRRRSQENILLAGDSSEARIGMLGAILAQVGINHSSTEAHVHLLDRSISGSPWHGVLPRIAQEHLLSNGYPVNVQSDANAVDAILEALVQELNRRSELPESLVLKEPAIYLLIHDAHRLGNLEKQVSRHGLKEPSKTGLELVRILEKGSEFGIHTVLSFNGVRPMQQILDNHELACFRHRIALQMPEDESFFFLRSRKGSTLQQGGNRPIQALYVNPVQNQEAQFKPYCYSEQNEDDYFDDLSSIQNQFSNT